MYLDSSILLLIPALLLAFWAQHKVKATYAKYAKVGNRRGITGAEVARRILQDADVPFDAGRSGRGVSIEPVAGNLTDHYDPRSHTLRLSEEVYYGTSVAALGIAAHEVGHAIQHARAYGPLWLRGVMYPASSLGSGLAFPLFFIGLFMPVGLGQIFLYGAITLFSAAVLFTLVTLPVEFNASNRALRALSSGGYLHDDEMAGARKVLSAAAMTYVAAAVMAVLQLVRMLLIANRR
jgi:uncharacterized protein